MSYAAIRARLFGAEELPALDALRAALDNAIDAVNAAHPSLDGPGGWLQYCLPEHWLSEALTAQAAALKRVLLVYDQATALHDEQGDLSEDDFVF